MPKDRVQLADAIRELRRELITAITGSEDEPIEFALGPVEVEFLIEIHRAAGAEARVQFWVSTGGTGEVPSGSTHRVRLSLEPQHRSGAPLEVADRWGEPGGGGIPPE
jgi:hypothetical protein